MALWVKKFGGTSMADLRCMQAVAAIIKRAHDAGSQCVVVVSAAAGHTDQLVNAANTITPLPQPREYDALLAAAEQTSAALLSILLCQQAIPAVSLTGQQAGILTNDHHNKADIIKVDTSAIEALLAQGKVVVVTGFQGVNRAGEITTLGRGGSDMSAVVLAGALKAQACYIYSDVKGVYSADPRLVPSAYRLDEISLTHMQQMAKLGAQVMQQQALDYCYQHEVPLRIASTFEPDQGTLITQAHQPTRPWTGVTCQTSQVQFTLSGINDWESSALALRRAMQAAKLEIDLVMQSHVADGRCGDLHFTVAGEDYHATHVIMDELQQAGHIAAVRDDPAVAKVSLIGHDVMAQPAVATEILSQLSAQGIKVRWFSSTAARMTWVVPQHQMPILAGWLHDQYLLPLRHLVSS